MQPNWIGVYPAITTKFKDNGDLDIEMNVKGLHAQVNAGVNGISLVVHWVKPVPSLKLRKRPC